MLTHILALDILHRNIKDAVGFVKVVDRADVWVVELRAELSFAFESFEVRGLSRQFRRQHLDNDRPVKLGVESLVNCTLAARADLFLDLVLVNLRTNHNDCGMRIADCGIRTRITVLLNRRDKNAIII